MWGVKDNKLAALAIIISTVTSVASGLTSVFLLVETRAQRSIAEDALVAQTWQLVNQASSDTLKLLVEHPYLRPYFNGNKAIPSDDLHFDEVMALAEMHLDYIEQLEDDFIYRVPHMQEGGRDRILWDNYFKELFGTSPALCQSLTEMKDSYSSKLERHKVLCKTSNNIIPVK